MIHQTLIKMLVAANKPDRYIGMRTNDRGHQYRAFDRRWDRLENINHLVAMYGLRHLGHGAFSAAWRMADGRVLKVGGEADDGFAFNEWAHHNMGDEGVPNVYEVRRVPGGWYCIMEEVMTAEARGYHDYACDEAEAAAERFAAETGGECEDTHSGNWGWTRDGRCVILDPTGCSTRLGLPPASRVVAKRTYGPLRHGAARWR